MQMKYAYLLLGVLLLIGDAAATDQSKLADEPAILVLSKTAGFRHGSIEVGVKMLRELGIENGFKIVHSEDSAIFTEL